MSTATDHTDVAVDRENNPAYSAPRVARQFSDFDVVKRLGEGSFSEVIQVTLRSSGEQFALKIVDKRLAFRHKQIENLKRERNLLDRLRNPGIIRLHFTFQDQDSLYFGLELCPNGELFDQIQRRKRLLIPDARQYAAEIVCILVYLKEQQIVHRDLKPENLILDGGGHLKLIDFGSAKQMDGVEEQAPTGASSQRTASLKGTVDYVSPEALNNKTVGYESDLWALGCVIYQMLHGTPPFRAGSEYLIFQKVAAGDYSMQDSFPEAAKDLIRSLLLLDPASRLGAGPGGLQELQSHPFFEGVDWDHVRSQPAPEVVQPAAGSEEEVGDDWGLRSMAESLPVRYEYDSNTSLPTSGKDSVEQS